MAPPAFYISTYMLGNVLSDSMADYYEDATIAVINNGGIRDYIHILYLYSFLFKYVSTTNTAFTQEVAALAANM